MRNKDDWWISPGTIAMKNYIKLYSKGRKHTVYQLPNGAYAIRKFK